MLIKLRIKSKNTKYSWKGNQKPPLNYHKLDPNSLLMNEVRNDRKSQHINSEEYYNLMNYSDNLPMIQIENDYVNGISKQKYNTR